MTLFRQSMLYGQDFEVNKIIDTEKDHVYLRFFNDGDPLGSTHTNAFEMNWRCGATPDNAPVTNRCEITGN